MAGKEMALYGKNSVFERLKTRPASIKKIFLQDSFDAPHIEKLIKANNIPVTTLSPKEMSAVKPAKDLQGIVAKTAGFEYASFNDLLALPDNKKTTIIFLDRLYDPQNLGVIIRTAACFGGFAVVIPSFNACEITEAVLHVASGGENYVPVIKVSNISGAIIKAKDSGYWIAGTVIDEDAEDARKVSFPFPLGIVLGSEGEGIRYGVEKKLDMKVRIPMDGAKLSFNVAMACAIFCYEICRQRK